MLWAVADKRLQFFCADLSDAQFSSTAGVDPEFALWMQPPLCDTDRDLKPPPAIALVVN